MALKFKASETFWKRFYDLPPEKKELIREKWKIFKENPFDPRLGTHTINRLTSIVGRSVFAVAIDGNLRVTFSRDGDVIYTITIGTHDIYK